MRVMKLKFHGESVAGGGSVWGVPKFWVSSLYIFFFLLPSPGRKNKTQTAEMLPSTRRYLTTGWQPLQQQRELCLSDQSRRRIYNIHISPRKSSVMKRILSMATAAAQSLFGCVVIHQKGANIIICKKGRDCSILYTNFYNLRYQQTSIPIMCKRSNTAGAVVISLFFFRVDI